MSDIEGKVTRLGATERGQRRSFNVPTPAAPRIDLETLTCDF
jgi:hypothetical protein